MNTTKGGYTDAVDDVLCKVLSAKTRKESSKSNNLATK